MEDGGWRMVDGGWWMEDGELCHQVGLSSMAEIKSFRELNVYRLALREARRIFSVTRDFPKEEKYALIDQIRRSSRAVGAMIGEAWGRRRYKAAFINKVNEAQAEAAEAQVWLDHARMCGYLDRDLYRELDREWQRVGAMLQRMIDRADSFCGRGTDAV